MSGLLAFPNPVNEKAARTVATAVFVLSIVMVAICLGCEVFALLMGAGVLPRSVCADCADISRLRRAAGGA